MLPATRYPLCVAERSGADSRRRRATRRSATGGAGGTVGGGTAPLSSAAGSTPVEQRPCGAQRSRGGADGDDLRDRVVRPARRATSGGRSGVVSTEMRCSPKPTMPTSCRAASLMPSGVLQATDVGSELGVGVAEHCQLVLLSGEIVVLLHPTLHRQHEQRGDQCGGDHKGDQREHDTLARPLTSCLSLAMGRVNSANATRRAIADLARDDDALVASRGR